MKRMHRRAALSVSAILIAAALILIYVPGLLIPETAVAAAFRMPGCRPPSRIPSEPTRWDAIF